MTTKNTLINRLNELFIYLNEKIKFNEYKKGNKFIKFI